MDISYEINRYDEIKWVWNYIQIFLTKFLIFDHKISSCKKWIFIIRYGINIEDEKSGSELHPDITR